MKFWDRTLAILQMLGGTMGIIITLRMLPETFSNLLFFVIALLFMALFGFSVIAGWLLWHETQRGVNWSTINQMLQIPQISVAGFAYYFINPVDMSLIVHSDGSDSLMNYLFNLDFDVGSQWFVSLADPTQPFFLGVNILPLLFFLYLRRRRPVEEVAPPLEIS